DARVQARLVPAGRVPVNDSLARHLVDERDGFLQSRFRRGQILALDCGPDAFQRASQARAKLPVVLAMLDTLTMGLDGRRMFQWHKPQIVPHPCRSASRT